MSRSSPVKVAYANGKVAYPDSPSLGRYREVRLSFDEAIKVIKATATKRILVSAPLFGLVEIDKSQALRGLEDKYLRKNAARIEQEKWVTVHVCLTISPIETIKQEASDKFKVQISYVGYASGDKEFTLR